AVDRQWRDDRDHGGVQPKHRGGVPGWRSSRDRTQWHAKERHALRQRRGNGDAGPMHNSIVWAGSPPVQLDQNGTASIRHSLVQGGAPTGVTDFAESSDSDPLFVEPPMNLRLLANSPAIDTGNTQLSGLTTLDVAGSPRVVDGDGDGTADIDRGAYEY